MKNYSGSFTALVATGILLAIAAICLAIWAASIALGADSATPCLTKEQARAKWPKEWIFWHGTNHCWDNVRGTANTANTADGTVKIIRAPKPNRAMKAGREDTPAPPIDASGNTAADYCCWPPLEPPFRERWLAMPANWLRP